MRQNSTYEKPHLAIGWRTWQLDELKRVETTAPLDSKILRDGDELTMRAELVKVALARSLEEEVISVLKNNIATFVANQPAWQTEYEQHRAAERNETQEGPGMLLCLHF